MNVRSLLALPLTILLVGCGQKPQNIAVSPTGHMELEYAQRFSVDFCDDGCSVIHIGDEDYLLVPEGQEIPQNSGDMTVIQQPVENVYLAASSAMDIFRSMDSLSAVTMTSTKAGDWTIPEVAEALDSGKMSYIGKYSAPDYEALLTGDCSLAIESTMILHSPETREQIEKLGIPVLVEHSSYESHPLGRMEWVKLYGLILGQYDRAEQIFNDYTAEFHEISVDEIPDDKRKTAVFFYLSPNGYVNIRKPGDYVSRMIELAGGKYAFTAEMLDIDENALSTMNVQLETFYQTAKDADVLIYNTTIEGELETLDDLVAKSDIFADMKAVQEGNVWCSTQDMFQQTMGEADMIKELNLIFTGKTDGADLKFLYPLG